MTFFRLTVSALALAAAAPAFAHDAHECVDEQCTNLALFSQAASTGTGSGSVEAVRMGTWGIDTAGMDTSVKPGDDFFGYVNGTWAKTTPIPADRSSYGGFAVLRDLSEARVRQLVEGYKLGDPTKDGDQAKVAAIYRSFMDEAAIEKLGAKPLKPTLAAIRAVKAKGAMATLMGRSLGRIGGSFFGAYVNDDSKNPDYYALYMSQSGLGLGDRELYLQEKFAPQKTRYQQYVAQMLGLAGWANAEKAAADIVAMETKIAEAHWTRAESRNRDKTYNPMTLAELNAQAPGFPWAAFMQAANVGKADKAIVSQNTAFPKLAAIFAATNLDTLKAWQAFHTVDDAAPLLSKAFVDANFEFRSKFMQGQPEQRERWKRGVSFAENAMGEAIGRDYVQLYYTPEAKAAMDDLVANIRVAMKKRIEGLEWMGAETKVQALAKLENFGLKIGHPDKWRDYSALQVRNGDLFGNMERAAQYEWAYRTNRLGQRVDDAEWGMTPQTVNAYYSPVKNEIVFPAAILQPPFFDPKADPAVNYGAIGGVIGHEISHGFDDQGRKSDGEGILRDWWTAEDAGKFEAQAARLGGQYEAYSFPTLPDMHINGRVAMGENIGDLGGVLLGLEAYRNSLDGKPAPVIDGFTGEQRLFMGWAQVWRTLWRDDALRQQIVNGPHSPGQIRAFAPLRNVDAWYDAFGIKEGDALYVKPEDRVRIW
ncbi:M13-type metalloendopeptidase [Sphingomonas sp. LY54]|uniref:M13 family metallopeptidase n=1 Tax=Sphingomonas sp. LY54 TaxID=3095343 RepID=UPI002D7820F8|nr:M13-type metalloendopeptidase [Sphingomonas sp. LY54]WRP29448.1 M13-type metalloendopeptidase [Sphingomonas sp. LY54]